SSPMCAGNTRTFRTGAERSMSASTHGPCRTDSGSMRTSMGSSTGSSNTSRMTVAGTANGSTARGSPPSTPRSTPSSGCSTIRSAPETLRGSRRPAARVATARCGGEEYLLARGLFRRRSSGEPFDDRVFVLFHPRRWFYGVLPAADCFRRAAHADAAAPDLRMTDAIESIRSEREDDGSWLQGHRLGGDVRFHVDVRPGQPSKWVTFHAC